MSNTVGGCGAGEESKPKKTGSPLAADAKYFKKKEKTRSTFWEHFTKVDVNGRTEAECNYCGKYLRWSVRTTSHLTRHLGSYCKGSYGGIAQPLTIAEGSYGGIAQPLTIAESNESFAVNLPPTIVSGEEYINFGVIEEIFREDQVKNAILGEFPFAPPNIKNAWSSFMLTDMEKEICASHQGVINYWEDEVKSAILAELPFAPPNVKKAWRHWVVDMEKEICAYHQREKEKLVTQLGNLTSQICFSVEIMEKTGWISIAAHFINDDFNLVKRLIGFKKLRESFEADIIESCISDWKLENKIFSFTTEWDEDLIKRLQGKFHSKLLFGGNHDKFVLPCFKKITEDCYSFYLQDDYVENMKIVENVLACPVRMRTFREIAKTKGLPPINEDWSKRKPISLYVETCRNFSSHKGASSHKFCQNKGASSHKWKFFCSLNKKFKEVLRYKEVFNEPSFVEISKPFAHLDCIRWRELEKIVNYFETINPIIDLLSNFKHPTSNLYFEKFTTTKKFWEDFGDDMANSDFHEMCILYAARVLDPRFKLKHSKDLGWGKGNSHFQTFFDTLFRIYGKGNSHFQTFFDTLFRIYAKEKTNQAYPSSFETANARERFLSTIFGFVDLTTGGSEMDEYLRKEMVDGEDTNFDLLGWWKQKRSSYPILSRMACDLLAIPACVYSVQESLTIDLSGLDEVSPELAEAVICSKDWILSDV